MNTTQTVRVVPVQSARFRTLAGVLKMVILTSAGQVELYRVETDGAEIFERYITTSKDLAWLGGGAAALDNAPILPCWKGDYVAPTFKRIVIKVAA